ncbi:MAG: hypothetical protein V2A34_03535 [Lentisphaerota bacterium]
MNWQEMSKERKQVLILAGIVAAGVLFVLVQYGLRPLFNSKKKATDELESLKAQLLKADNIIGRDSLIRTELTKSSAELNRAMEQCIVPRDNPLSWVTEKIYRGAREVGIDIESVAEVSSALSSRDKQKQTDRVFAVYSVRIITQCGYAQIVQLVEALEKSNPYLCISGISIAAQDRMVEKHAISLIVDWPMKMDTPAIPPSGLPTGAAGMPKPEA